jgi:hypothetical protein
MGWLQTGVMLYHTPLSLYKMPGMLHRRSAVQYPGTRITRRAAGWVRELLRGRLPIKAVQEITGIHWDTIHRIHKEMMEEALESRAEELRKAKYKPTRLAWMSSPSTRGIPTPPAVMDLDTGEVIWAGKGRSKEDFKHFFEDMPEGYLSQFVLCHGHERLLQHPLHREAAEGSHCL